MNYPARNSEKIRKIVRSCFNQMLARNDYLGKTQLSLGLGFSVKEAENIKDSFVLANRSLAERLLEGNSKILEADVSNGVLYEKKLVDKFTRNLGSALQTLDVEEIRNTINPPPTFPPSVSINQLIIASFIYIIISLIYFLNLSFLILRRQTCSERRK